MDTPNTWQGLKDAWSGKRTTPIDYGHLEDPQPVPATRKQFFTILATTILFFLLVAFFVGGK